MQRGAFESEGVRRGDRAGSPPIASEGAAGYRRVDRDIWKIPLECIRDGLKGRQALVAIRVFYSVTARRLEHSRHCGRRYAHRLVSCAAIRKASLLTNNVRTNAIGQAMMNCRGQA